MNVCKPALFYCVCICGLVSLLFGSSALACKNVYKQYTAELRSLTKTSKLRKTERYEYLDTLERLYRRCFRKPKGIKLRLIRKGKLSLSALDEKKEKSTAPNPGKKQPKKDKTKPVFGVTMSTLKKEKSGSMRSLPAPEIVAPREEVVETIKWYRTRRSYTSHGFQMSLLGQLMGVGAGLTIGVLVGTITGSFAGFQNTSIVALPLGVLMLTPVGSYLSKRPDENASYWAAFGGTLVGMLVAAAASGLVFLAITGLGLTMRFVAILTSIASLYFPPLFSSLFFNMTKRPKFIMTSKAPSFNPTPASSVVKVSF